jgi:hypothetical protein
VQQTALSFDHLVGAQQERLNDFHCNIETKPKSGEARIKTEVQRAGTAAGLRLCQSW